MNQNTSLERARLKTPRAAAIAGVLFSVLLIAALILIRLSIPSTPNEPGAWLQSSPRQVTLALNIVPFAGIAFLWFIGVVRDRLGESEDKLFATVFFGSGLLFLCLTFTSAAVAGGLLLTFSMRPEFLQSSDYTFGRSITYVMLNTYAMRMAGVFMLSSSTLFLRLGVTPRWMALVGYGCALALLIIISHVSWISLLFPVWVLLVSLYILVENLRSKPGAAAAEA